MQLPEPALLEATYQDRRFNSFNSFSWERGSSDMELAACCHLGTCSQKCNLGCSYHMLLTICIFIGM